MNKIKHIQWRAIAGLVVSEATKERYNHQCQQAPFTVVSSLNAFSRAVEESHSTIDRSARLGLQVESALTEHHVYCD